MSKSIDYITNIPYLQNKDIIFHVSIYENGIPGSGKTKYRNNFYIKDLQKDLYSILNQCKSHQEIAIHSDIKINGRPYHLSQIDFKIEENKFTPKLREYFSRYMHNTGFHKFHIFNSGRSLHGYGENPIKEDLGKYYLNNIIDFSQEFSKKFGADIVDTKRVEHSINNGSSALRLTHNTKAYNTISKFQETIIDKKRSLR